VVIVLGIDPGLANTGYGVVESAAGRLVALDGGVIETGAAAPQEQRLAEIHAAVDALLEAGAEVAGVAVVVDRGARERIAERGLPYRAAYELADLGLG